MLASQFAEFATREARGESPIYERLSLALSRDDEVLDLVAALPPDRHQPNLLYGVVRFLGGPVDDPAAFHDYVTANWAAVEAVLRTRAVQTNEVGHGQPLLECAATGLVPPARVPEVVWRAGIDLNPLDVTDPADVAWLEALIWPEQSDRRERLRAAIAVVAADPPILVRGDLLDELAGAGPRTAGALGGERGP